LSFTDGYINAPRGIYFGYEFTVLAWVRLRAYLNYSRLFDFGNGYPMDNVLVGLTWPGNFVASKMYVFNKDFTVYSNINLDLNTWYHVALKLEANSLYIYKNGNLYGSKNLVSFSNRIVYRDFCYIGKSNWPTDPNANADYDEIKIFNRALSDSELFEQYISSQILNR
jgi:arabinan endo-1,5-alpha-L-arabinosidase